MTPTVPGCVVAGELLEISRLKAFVVAIDCPHHTWPRLTEHLDANSHTLS